MRAKEFIIKEAPAPNPGNDIAASAQKLQKVVTDVGKKATAAAANPATQARDAQIQQQRKTDPNYQKGVTTVDSNRPVRKAVDNSQPTDSTTTVTGSGYRGGGGYGRGERTATTAIATGQDTTGTDMRTNLDRAYQDGQGRLTTRGGSIAPTGKDNFQDANYQHLRNPETGEVTKHANTSQEKAGLQGVNDMVDVTVNTDVVGNAPGIKQAAGLDANDSVSVKNLGTVANKIYNKAAADFDKDQAAKFQQQAQAQAAARAQQQKQT